MYAHESLGVNIGLLMMLPSVVCILCILFVLERADDVSHTNSGERETYCAAMGSNFGSRTGHMFEIMRLRRRVSHFLAKDKTRIDRYGFFLLPQYSFTWHPTEQ